MQSENPLVADVVKLLNSAAGTFAGMGREARDGARERIKEAIGGVDFVTREEFGAVKDMAKRVDMMLVFVALNPDACIWKQFGAIKMIPVNV